MANYKASDITATTKISIGTSPNTIDLTPSGLLFNGSSTIFKVLSVPLINLGFSEMEAGIAAPSSKEFMDSTGFPGTALAKSALVLKHFEAADESSLSFSLSLQNDWKLGSSIFPNVHWISKTASAGNVKFGIEIMPIKPGQLAAYSLGSTDRESTGTTRKIHFAAAHEFRTGRQIVVSGMGDASYNGDSTNNDGTFVITGYSNTNPNYWIQYTGTGALEEAKTADVAATVTGYSYRFEATDVQLINNQGKEYRTALGTILMDIHNALFTKIFGRIYRVKNADVPGGLNEDIAVISLDFHYEADSIGASEETVK